MKQRCKEVVQRCKNRCSTFHNVVSTLYNVVKALETDIVSTLSNVETQRLFSTRFCFIFYIISTLIQNFETTLKCWLGFVYYFIKSHIKMSQFKVPWCLDVLYWKGPTLLLQETYRPPPEKLIISNRDTPLFTTA